MNRCEWCNREFANRRNYQRHQEKSCSERHRCTECDRVYSSRYNLNKHQRSKHGHEKQLGNGNQTNIVGGNVMSNSHNVINNNIYLTRDPDFLEKLIKLKGGEEQALQAIKRAVYHKVKGEVELFGEMYLQGDDPSRWSVMCVDPETNFFKIRMEDGSWEPDPGAVKSRIRFYGNYTDSVLHLMNMFIFEPLLDRSDLMFADFDLRAGSAMDFVDMNSLQSRLCEVTSQRFDQELFARELTRYYLKRVRDIRNLHKDDPCSMQRIMLQAGLSEKSVNL